jgi:VWFA-related protein
MLAAALLGYSATVVAQAAPSSTPRSDQQDKPAPFRVSVDVVAVDVQVIGRDGRPVPDLGPEKFSVAINGKRRRVLTAERIGGDDGEGPGTVSNAPLSTLKGRVIVLAVDCVSFDATESRHVIQAAREFVKQLSPDDFIGLSAYPNGPKVDPTTDHEAVFRALNLVVGQRDLAERTQFHVRPAEIVDITRELTRGGGPTLDAVIARECGGTTELPDPFCRNRLITDVTNTALYLEGEGTASLGVLRSLVEQMGAFNGRKTLVLISGGLLASDTPGGRPDLAEMGLQVGKAAAFANTAIYTLHVDSSFIERYSAQTRAGDKNVVNWQRDSQLMSRWLEQFSGAAGGALFSVQVGNAAQALNRIRTELSSYYLLGVEPEDEDRDGRTHEIAVKTTQPNVTIRGRRWVMVPKRFTSAAAAASTAAAAGPSAATPPPATTPAAPAVVRREVPSDVQAIVDVFNRGNYDGMSKTLAESPNLANVIRGFRMSDSPWPNDPKRSAVFALEMAFAGLRSENAPAREEGARLLAEYHVRVRQPQGADEFECWWFLTEAAALEGMFLPENALQFIPRALVRCPTTPRLHLAYAFVSEQQWMRGGLTATQETEIVTRYEAAMKFPETEPEARVRAARFLHSLGQDERALQVLDGATTPPKDKELEYFAQLTRGQILRARNRGDEASAAFRAALAAWPGAQSARVALMTRLVTRGDREGAATLAEAAQTASDNDFDPWWTYWLGDYRGYPMIVERLRQLAR